MNLHLGDRNRCDLMLPRSRHGIRIVRIGIELSAKVSEWHDLDVYETAFVTRYVPRETRDFGRASLVAPFLSCRPIETRVRIDGPRTSGVCMHK